MAQLAPVGSTVNLVLTLDKDDTGKYPRAFVYDTAGALLSTINLSEVGEGIYRYTYTLPSTSQDMYVVYKVYTDSGHTTLDTSMPSHATDTIYGVSSLSSGASSYSYTHTITNTVTSAPVEGANVYVYSDAGRTTIIASGVTDALGQCTTYHDAAGTYYRTIIASGFSKTNDSITVS